VFSFEGSFRYQLLREYYPEEYAKLRQYIDRGQWRICGSWVDAVDVNMPSFESLVRQVLYGNGYFRKEFGVTTRDVFLPDCFGFGYALPSIASHCGLKSFSSQKLSWGSAYGVPFDIGTWKGSTVRRWCRRFARTVTPPRLKPTLPATRSGPTRWSARSRFPEYRLRTCISAPATPAARPIRCRRSSGRGDTQEWLAESLERRADDLVDLVGEENLDRLPRYKGELVMTRHGVGCYTSQAAMKRWNRKNELLADAAERASVIADYLAGCRIRPRPFVTPGSLPLASVPRRPDRTSIPEAYEFSWNDEILCQNRFSEILTERSARRALPSTPRPRVCRSSCTIRCRSLVRRRSRRPSYSTTVCLSISKLLTPTATKCRRR